MQRFEIGKSREVKGQGELFGRRAKRADADRLARAARGQESMEFSPAAAAAAARALPNCTLTTSRRRPYLGPAARLPRAPLSRAHMSALMVDGSGGIVAPAQLKHPHTHRFWIERYGPR